jgi:hypothetical protein
LRYGAGCRGNLESVVRARQDIQLALPRFVKMSNFGGREFDVNLGPHCGRKIFSKIPPGDQLRAWRRADAKIGDLAWPGKVCTRARAMARRSKHRKTRKRDTTDRTLVAPEREGSLLRFPPDWSRGRSAISKNSPVRSPSVLRCVSLRSRSCAAVRVPAVCG